jgi:circadian clock protein KaiB
VNSKPDPDPAQEVVLRLFVTGASQRSSRAIEAVQSICRDYFRNGVRLQIVDVLERPEEAESQRIIATPTLIRQSPGPPRRLIGDVTEAGRIIRLLGLADRLHAKEEEEKE